jgi:hypothetical protein
MLTQDLLKYLGILATTWMSRNVAPELERVPAEIVVEAVEQSRGSVGEADRLGLYRLLAQDQREEVRGHLRKWLRDDKHLTDLRKLAEDSDERVRALAADVLREKLARARPDEQTAWATTFALSLESGPRLALARALGGNVPDEADYLYVLANDGDASVRMAALEATLRLAQAARATEKGTEIRESFVDIFESRLEDPVRTIRKKARRGFTQASA